MKVKLSISYSGILNWLLKNTNKVVLTFSILLIIWFGYFCYVNIYSTIISPKEIPSTEITAKKQQVNIELFNQINTSIKTKQELKADVLRNLRNPF